MNTIRNEHRYTATSRLFSKAIRSSLFTTALLLAVTFVLTPNIGWTDRTEAISLVEQAQQLIDQEKYEQAGAKLQAALQADPTYAETYATLGHLHEIDGEVEQAVDSYGHALELAPNHGSAQIYMHHLFYEARFPRWLKLDYLKFSPISAVVDTCQTRLPGNNGAGSVAHHDFTYTTSLIFPEEMGRTDPAVKVRIPSTGSDSPIYATVNRVCYGLISNIPRAPSANQTTTTPSWPKPSRTCCCASQVMPQLT